VSDWVRSPMWAYRCTRIGGLYADADDRLDGVSVNRASTPMVAAQLLN
jgi:hypothetical protein